MQVFTQVAAELACHWQLPSYALRVRLGSLSASLQSAASCSVLCKVKVIIHPCTQLRQNIVVAFTQAFGSRLDSRQRRIADKAPACGSLTPHGHWTLAVGVCRRCRYGWKRDRGSTLCTQLTQYRCHRRPSHCGKPRGVRSGPWVNPRLLCYSYVAVTPSNSIWLGKPVQSAR